MWVRRTEEEALKLADLNRRNLRSPVGPLSLGLVVTLGVFWVLLFSSHWFSGHVLLTMEIAAGCGVTTFIIMYAAMLWQAHTGTPDAWICTSCFSHYHSGPKCICGGKFE